jgi:hypothetical protein
MLFSFCSKRDSPTGAASFKNTAALPALLLNDKVEIAPFNVIARRESVVRLTNDVAIAICFFLNDKKLLMKTMKLKFHHGNKR